jgi:hypothetical protein
MRPSQLLPICGCYIMLAAASVPAVPLNAVTGLTRGKKRSAATPVTIDGVVFPTGYPDLVPTSTVDLATDSTYTTQNVSPTRVPMGSATSSQIPLRTETEVLQCVANVSGTVLATPCPSSTTETVREPVTVDGIVYSTGFPDLVPTSRVNLATDSTFTTQAVSPTRVPDATATGILQENDAAKKTSGTVRLSPPLLGMLLTWLR